MKGKSFEYIPYDNARCRSPSLVPVVIYYNGDEFVCKSSESVIDNISQHDVFGIQDKESETFKDIGTLHINSKDDLSPEQFKGVSFSLISFPAVLSDIPG